MTGTRFVLASANPHKVAEIRAILSAVGIELAPRPPDVPDVEETGATLEDNARLKARALCSATGLPAIADDTGLEVAALQGAPGVHSARYAGDAAIDSENVAKLLADLEGSTDRHARFVTVALAVWPDGRRAVARGVVEGEITTEPRGFGGFGCDPVFVPVEGDGRTFAEMTPDEKHAISHRGRAFRNLADLPAFLEGS